MPPSRLSSEGRRLTSWNCNRNKKKGNGTLNFTLILPVSCDPYRGSDWSFLQPFFSCFILCLITLIFSLIIKNSHSNTCDDDVRSADSYYWCHDLNILNKIFKKKNDSCVKCICLKVSINTHGLKNKNAPVHDTKYFVKKMWCVFF